VTPIFKPPSIDRLIEVDLADCQYKSGIFEIEGIVSPSSQSASARSDDYDVHFFSFSAWRYPGQPLVNRKLIILRPVNPTSDSFSEYPKLSIHRLRVMISMDESRAILARNSTQKPDTNGLIGIAEELKNPVIVYTERFGDLALDRSVSWFEGEVKWNGEQVRINFNTDEDLDLSASLEVAEKLLDEQEIWKQNVDEYAAKELLPLKNEHWRNESESAITVEQFKSRLSLVSISLNPDGSIEFWHDDGDLFWGHSIHVSGSLDEGLTHAGIMG